VVDVVSVSLQFELVVMVGLIGVGKQNKTKQTKQKKKGEKEEVPSNRTYPNKM
jgi:hypothetical protein